LYNVHWRSPFVSAVLEGKTGLPNVHVVEFLEAEEGEVFGVV